MRGKNGKPGPPAHEDLVELDFTALGPNKLWLTDITEHPTGEGKLYLCAVKEVWSGRIVGYSIDARMKSRLAVQALDNAVATRAGRGRGWLHRPLRPRQPFPVPEVPGGAAPQHVVGSMGKVGTSADNAAMGSFFALLQKNVLDRRWATRQDLRISIVTCLERTHHRRRRQDRLGRLTPIEYEATMATVAPQAVCPNLSPTRAAVPWSDRGA